MGDHALFSYPPSPVAVHNPSHSSSSTNRPTTADPRYAQPLHRSVWPTPSPPSPPPLPCTSASSSFRAPRPMTAPSLVSSVEDPSFLSFSSAAAPPSAGLAPTTSTANTPTHFSYPFQLPPPTDIAAASQLWDYQNSAGSYTSYAQSRPSDVHLHQRPMTADSYSLPTSASFYSAGRPVGLLEHSQPKKRARRRYDEIERMYACNYQGCSKAYGTLNHLNAHISMQKHGPKRLPHEFKEIRKEYRARKKAEEAAQRRRAVAAHSVVQRPISANPADPVAAVGLGVPYAFAPQLSSAPQQLSHQIAQQIPQPVPQSIPHSVPPQSLPQSISHQSIPQASRVHSADFSTLSYPNQDVSSFYTTNQIVHNGHPNSATQHQLPNLNTSYSSATTPSSSSTTNAGGNPNKLKLDSHNPTDFGLDHSSSAKMDLPASSSNSLAIPADSTASFNPLKIDSLDSHHETAQFAALARDSHTWPGSA